MHKKDPHTKIIVCGGFMLKRILIALLRIYQKTPIFAWSNCRFFPSCSEYAVGALRKHSVPYAFYLIVKRLCKCAPWHPGGEDQVP